MQIKISIIVPVYKVEKELDRCVQSLLKQTYENIEIILVDDGSPDCCPKLCDEYAKNDSRVSVIHKKNGGLSDARNAGLRIAKGEYILYIDSDDYIDLNSCAYFVEAIKNQKIDIVVGNAVMEKNEKIEYMVHTATSDGRVYMAEEFIKKSIKASQWYAPACFNMYRREFLIQNNLYFKEGIYFEDMQMLPRVFLLADKITCINRVFYHYIVRENSIMTSKDNKKKNDALQNLREWKDCFDNVKDIELQTCLYGMLLKCYLYECRIYGIKRRMIQGIDFRFMMKYSLSWKERIKCLLWLIVPGLYCKL